MTGLRIEQAGTQKVGETAIDNGLPLFAFISVYPKNQLGVRAAN